jgi:hypothetical protein
MAEEERSTGVWGGFDLRLVVLFLSLPCLVLLPFWVYDAQRSIAESG